jgi:two-component system chemotaxis response regulator CheB
MPANALSVLAKIIDRSGPLPAVSACRAAGRVIQVCVPDRHLFVAHGRSALSKARPKRLPPSHQYAVPIRGTELWAASICVLLSGVLDTGAGRRRHPREGRNHGCSASGDALYPAIPMNAIRAGVVDYQSRRRSALCWRS